MQKRPLPRTRTRPANAAQTRTLPWQYLLVIFVCAGVLAAGFFFAARQHFMSMEYGFKNSQLRKQLEDLEAEKRRLLLAREVSLSPVEIRKATLSLNRESAKVPSAVHASVKDRELRNVEQLQPAKEVKTTAAVKPVETKVVRTSSTRPADPNVQARREKAKKNDNSRKQKDISTLTAVAKLR